MLHLSNHHDHDHTHHCMQGVVGHLAHIQSCHHHLSLSLHLPQIHQDNPAAISFFCSIFLENVNQHANVKGWHQEETAAAASLVRNVDVTRGRKMVNWRIQIYQLKSKTTLTKCLLIQRMKYHQNMNQITMQMTVHMKISVMKMNC